MPMYEYECAACGHRFERIQKFSDPPVDVCPNCGESRVQKLLSSPAIQFKGTGWYITDYAKKDGAGTDAKPSASTDASKDTSKDMQKSSESKESKESKETKSTSPTSGTTGTAKASGE